MRNFNTSLAKNAIRIFANEASQLLRAFTDPATCLPRFIQSIVRTILAALSKLRLMQVQGQIQAYGQGQSLVQTTANAGMLEIIGRILLVISFVCLGGEHGYRPWDCRLSSSVS